MSRLGYHRNEASLATWRPTASVASDHINTSAEPLDASTASGRARTRRRRCTALLIVCSRWALVRCPTAMRVTDFDLYRPSGLLFQRLPARSSRASRSRPAASRTWAVEALGAPGAVSSVPGPTAKAADDGDYLQPTRLHLVAMAQSRGSARGAGALSARLSRRGLKVGRAVSSFDRLTSEMR